MDRETDGLPCEELSPDIAGQFSEYESGLEATDEDSTEETATEEESTEETVGAEESSDEGDALPVTATSYPTIMFLGLLAAGAGALLLFR